MLAAVRWSSQPDRSRTASWAGLAAAIVLALVCFAYYQVTRSLSLAPAWYFLLTFLAAWPLAVPAARRLLEPGTVVADLFWMLAVFSIYYWSAGGLMLLRVAVGRQ